MVKVSVVVPVYNVEDYLEKCLDSLINQTLKDIEIICVNDGSTDNSKEILEKYAKNDLRIRVITQDNAGLSVARNTGIKEALGEYIAFLDSDDYVDYDFYEKLYEAALGNQADISIGCIVRENNKKKKYLVKYSKQENYETIKEKYKAAHVPEYCFVWNKIYSSKIFRELNIEFIIGRTYEDMPFTSDVLECASKVVTVPNTYYHYIIRENSIIKTDSDKKRADKLLSYRYLIDKCFQYNIFSQNKDVLLKKDTYYLLGIKVLKVYCYRATKKYYLFGLLHFLTIKESI